MRWPLLSSVLLPQLLVQSIADDTPLELILILMAEEDYTAAEWHMASTENV
jgi:hypothetical protein